MAFLWFKNRNASIKTEDTHAVQLHILGGMAFLQNMIENTHTASEACREIYRPNQATPPPRSGTSRSAAMSSKPDCG